MKQLGILFLFCYLTWLGYNKFINTESFKYGIYTNHKIGFSVEVPLNWTPLEKEKIKFYQFGYKNDKINFLAIPSDENEAAFSITILSIRSSAKYELDGVTSDVIKRRLTESGGLIVADKISKIDGLLVMQLVVKGQAQDSYEYAYYVVDNNIVQLGFKFAQGQRKKYNESKIRIISSFSLK